MTETRTTRKDASREAQLRRKPWTPPSHLEAPEPPQVLCIDG